MGWFSSSKKVKAEGEEVNSSGFHLIELHIPTAGMSFIVVLGILAFLILGYYIHKRFKARQRMGGDNHRRMEGLGNGWRGSFRGLRRGYEGRGFGHGGMARPSRNTLAIEMEGRNSQTRNENRSSRNEKRNEERNTNSSMDEDDYDLF